MKKYYYVTGNTAEGFVNFLSSNIVNLQQVVSLKHFSQSLKSNILKHLITKYEKTYELEVLKSALGEDYLDGVIIREKSIAFLNQSIVPDGLGGVIEIDLSRFTRDKPNHDVTLEQKMKQHSQQAYEHFATGLRIHDDLEAIYIQEMNFDRANKLADAFIKEILEGHPKKERKAHQFHRLFGTTTVDGPVNVVPHITESLSHVFYLKGRAGTGKSTFMKKVANACMEHGYDMEIHHCSFDPNSIDMVLVAELDFCIFDSTDPHEFFPSREGEEVIDLYEETVTPGTDEKYADEIKPVHSNYKSFMKRGVAELKKAGEYLETLEQQYQYTENVQEQIVEFLVQMV